MALGAVYAQQPQDAEHSDEQKIASQAKLARAGELLWQLKSWQESKDWENFFAFRDSYEGQIESLISSVGEPLHLKLKAKYLLYNLKDFLGKKAKKQALSDLVEEFYRIEKADSQTLSLLKDMISDLSVTPKRTVKRKLSSLYVRLLKSSQSFEMMRQEAENFYLSRDMDNFVALSKAYLSFIDDENMRKRYILRLVEKAVCDGFQDTCAPYFAEELFDSLERDFQVSLGEGLLYLRGYNLERAFEYEKAIIAYNRLLSDFAASDLFDEVVLRIGLMYMYNLKDFDSARMYFRKLKEGTFGVEKYLDILNDQYDLETLGYNQRVFLDVLLNPDAVNAGVLQLESSVWRTFVDNKLSIESTSFVPNTGCLEPEGLFLWSGDLGDVKITTSTPSFSTSFKEEGFKVFHLVEKLTEGAVGADSAVIAVYAVDLSSIEDNGNRKDFEAVIRPPLPESLTTFSWKISKDAKPVIEESGDSFFQVFRDPGIYDAELSLFFLGRKVHTQSSSFIIE